MPVSNKHYYPLFLVCLLGLFCLLDDIIDGKLVSRATSDISIFTLYSESQTVYAGIVPFV